MYFPMVSVPIIDRFLSYLQVFLSVAIINCADTNSLPPYLEDLLTNDNTIFFSFKIFKEPPEGLSIAGIVHNIPLENSCELVGTENPSYQSFDILKFGLTKTINGIYQIRDGELDMIDYESDVLSASVSFAKISGWRIASNIYSKEGFVEVISSPKTIEELKTGMNTVIRVNANFPNQMINEIKTIECSSGSVGGTECSCRLSSGQVNQCKTTLMNHDCCEEEFGTDEKIEYEKVDIIFSAIHCRYLCSANDFQLYERYCINELGLQ